MKTPKCRKVLLPLLLALPMLLMGCLGWGDMFAPKHVISGDYSLMQGEEGNDVYLLVKGSSTSVAGPIHQIGWNKQYIVFTDANWPNPWNVVRVEDHHTFRISQEQLLTNPALKNIRLMSPSAAWNERAK